MISFILFWALTVLITWQSMGQSQAGLENEKKNQSVHSEQNRYFNVSVPAFLMYYYRSETG